MVTTGVSEVPAMFMQHVPWCARISVDIDPAVAFVLCKTGGVKAARELEADAGLGHDTIRLWLYGNGERLGPGIKTVRRALNALGYDLVVSPLDR